MMNQNSDKKPKISAQIAGFTLVETLISTTIIAVLFLVVTLSFNSILVNSTLVDARLNIREQSDFVVQYITQVLKTADSRSLVCNQGGTSSIKWQPAGNSLDQFTQVSFSNSGFILTRKISASQQPVTYLTYPDVIVHDVSFICNTVTDQTGVTSKQVVIQFQMDSVVQFNKHAAVRNVSRYITVSVK